MSKLKKEFFTRERRNNCLYLCPFKETIFRKEKFSNWIALFPLKLPMWSANIQATSRSHQGYPEPASDFFRVYKHPQWFMVQLHRTALPWGKHQHADRLANRELYPVVGHYPSHQHQDHRQLDEHHGAQEGAGHLAQVSGPSPWKEDTGSTPSQEKLCQIPDSMKLGNGTA